jgi:lipopolysaccharide/colanic/teichoic acid biosynthesis glycosyltransferase
VSSTASESASRAEVREIPAAATSKARAQALIALEVPAHELRGPTAGTLLYRAAETVAAICAFVVALPVMVVEAIVIKLDSPGPALFAQRRIGRSRIVRGSELLGRTDIAAASGAFEPDKHYYVPTEFTFYKFRTMYVDATQRNPELYRVDFASHEAFRDSFYKHEDDPRVTRVGRWLRKSTIDELPNLLNVVTGNVAMVGPRPEGPWFLPYYSAEEMRKFTVRPGITGLAVVNGRGELSIGGQLDWDLAYVRDHSVVLDIGIILKTLWLVVLRRGAF